jgi:hypothetical protein
LYIDFDWLCYAGGDDDEELVAPAPADGDREPLIDSVLAQKKYSAFPAKYLNPSFLMFYVVVVLVAVTNWHEQFVKLHSSSVWTRSIWKNDDKIFITKL